MSLRQLSHSLWSYDYPCCGRGHGSGTAGRLAAILASHAACWPASQPFAVSFCTRSSAAARWSPARRAPWRMAVRRRVRRSHARRACRGCRKTLLVAEKARRLRPLVLVARRADVALAFVWTRRGHSGEDGGIAADGCNGSEVPETAAAEDLPALIDPRLAAVGRTPPCRERRPEPSTSRRSGTRGTCPCPESSPCRCLFSSRRRTRPRDCRSRSRSRSAPDPGHSAARGSRPRTAAPGAAARARPETARPARSESGLKRRLRRRRDDVRLADRPRGGQRLRWWTEAFRQPSLALHRDGHAACGPARRSLGLSASAAGSSTTCNGPLGVARACCRTW